jgi:hypothetical protein
VGTSLHSFLVSIPLAIALWALMLLGVAAAVVLIGRPRGSAAPAASRSGSAAPAAASRSGHAAPAAAFRSGPAASAASRCGFAAPAAASAGSAASRPRDGGSWRRVGGSVASWPRVGGSWWRSVASRRGAAASAAPWWRAVDAAASRSRSGRSVAGDSATADSVGDSAAAGPAACSRLDDPAGRSLADDLRFADEVTVAAEHAAATAARGRGGWEAAERELDAAWAAYQEADAAARRIWAATSFPLMSRRRRLGENADRERYLHRAATAACRQRELSIGQLNDIYAHRGWNPRLHPVVQEALLRNAIRENAFVNYQAAQRRERAAWQQAEIAAEALRALRAEAAAAFGRTAAEQPVASEFWWAEPWTTGELPVAA